MAIQIAQNIPNEEKVSGEPEGTFIIKPAKAKVSKLAPGKKSLKGCIEPFEKAFEITKDETIKKAVAEYLGGSEKNFQFLIGQSMRALKGKADPQMVRTTLQMLLDQMR